MTRWSKEDFLGSETILDDTITVDIGHYILVKTQECTTPRVNPNVNYGLKVVMTCRRRFIDCNKSPTLVGMLRVGETVPVWRQGVHGQPLYHPGSKTAPENKAY